MNPNKYESAELFKKPLDLDEGMVIYERANLQTIICMDRFVFKAMAFLHQLILDHRKLKEDFESLKKRAEL